MKRNWSLFAGAAVLAGYFLIAGGAPPIGVVAGLGFGAFLTHRATRSV